MQQDYYLGLDLSTQQLKCTIIDEEHTIVFEEAVNFDRDLPEYQTTHGAIVKDNVATAPTIMWVKALDKLLEKLKQFKHVQSIRGISGAGQQHGSVYWNEQGLQALNHLDAEKSLVDQLKDAFSVPQSPIWQDSSTTEECRSLEKSVGGPEALAKLTGSKAYERFTGSQISKIYSMKGDAYNATVRINLISSLLASLFLGEFGPMDAAEGSGTNLMDINSHKWNKHLLEHCGGTELYDKIHQEPVEGGTVMGKIDSYYVERYGFNPDCLIMPFTGDNSATLASMNLEEGDCVVSLGTSDTVLVYLKKENAKPTIESHLMAHPSDPSGFMGMLCYKNGSLAREYIRDTYADGEWDDFNRYLKDKEAMFDGKIGFYYRMQEIIPFAKGIYRFQDGQAVGEFQDKTVNVKAIVESQFMSMKIRLGRMSSSGVKRVLASGGAATNGVILQLLSDILGLPVYRQKGMNGASLGGALLAKFGTLHEISFKDMMSQRSHHSLELICEPSIEKTKQYDSRVDQYKRLETSIV